MCTLCIPGMNSHSSENIELYLLVFTVASASDRQSSFTDHVILVNIFVLPGTKEQRYCTVRPVIYPKLRRSVQTLDEFANIVSRCTFDLQSYSVEVIKIIYAPAVTSARRTRG